MEDIIGEDFEDDSPRHKKDLQQIGASSRMSIAAAGDMRVETKSPFRAAGCEPPLRLTIQPSENAIPSNAIPSENVTFHMV